VYNVIIFYSSLYLSYHLLVMCSIAIAHTVLNACSVLSQRYRNENVNISNTHHCQSAAHPVCPVPCNFDRLACKLCKQTFIFTARCYLEYLTNISLYLRNGARWI